jgi:crotonobetainyl-CoA:carnitine CoA-transferase CaiB-like acyl-CoA transferase
MIQADSMRSGIRVVDLTRILAGPFCSMLLADMGAVVIKIETPGERHPLRRLNAAGVPCDRVKTLPEVFADPKTIEQQMVLSAEHPGHGAVTMLGFPVKFADAPCRVYRPAPDLGADTDEVLRELGCSAEEVARWRAAGVV